ncbi:MAG TPA: 23S rRNA (pseudouridine(1915)-N(3))-methyltransferase RlmH [Bryobacteraceae bacterium]|nr:23S rRNA (pseudouridine(1915)-N(3))-methyltransferase RlmH [Bryobacteraceae bacterium]
MKLYLYYIGKPRDAHANAMADEYVKRVGRWVRCEMAEIRPTRADPWAKPPAATKILLDPSGKPLDSARFAKLISTAEQQSRDLVFVVGGADGLPQGWPSRAGLLLSLSPMTFPHELARAMLAEQIYRAFTSLRGHPYPR